MTNWIKVSDRLPEDDVDVLVFVGDDAFTVGYLSAGKWILDYQGLEDQITHWQPLPEPPVKK